MRRQISVHLYIIALVFMLFSGIQASGEIIVLTLDRAVEIAMENSYQIRQLKLGIERSREWLRAEQAGLKSKVYMSVKAPEFSAISDYKWDSNLSKDVIVRQNTQRWWMNLAVRQPVILFGYPTNGYLSLNNTLYQYNQLDSGLWDRNYYNRYFLKFEQPFFQPNRLKNELEEAKLSLEENELEFLDDQVDLIERISRDYYELFSYSYTDIILDRYIKSLEYIQNIAECSEKADGSKSIDCSQIQIELTNSIEKKAQNLSDFRLEATRVKQRLRLNELDSLHVRPEIKITKINVDLKQAIQYGHTLRPRMRLLDINRRKREIDLTNVKGWNAFRMNVEMTYGLEKQDESYKELWNEFDNSYSVTVNAYVPIWDWGQRKARIAAQEITIRKTELYQEETRSRIESEIKNAYQNLQEYQKRTLSMQENKQMAEELTTMSIEQYANGEITVQDLLQTLERQKETEENFLEAYLGYRKSIIGLTIDTYYDYENDIALLDKFRSAS